MTPPRQTEILFPTPPAAILSKLQTAILLPPPPPSAKPKSYPTLLAKLPTYPLANYHINPYTNSNLTPPPPFPAMLPPGKSEIYSNPRSGPTSCINSQTKPYLSHTTRLLPHTQHSPNSVGAVVNTLDHCACYCYHRFNLDLDRWFV